MAIATPATPATPATRPQTQHEQDQDQDQEQEIDPYLILAHLTRLERAALLLVHQANCTYAQAAALLELDRPRFVTLVTRAYDHYTDTERWLHLQAAKAANKKGRLA